MHRTLTSLEEGMRRRNVRASPWPQSLSSWRDKTRRGVTATACLISSYFGVKTLQLVVVEMIDGSFELVKRQLPCRPLYGLCFAQTAKTRGCCWVPLCCGARNNSNDWFPSGLTDLKNVKRLNCDGSDVANVWGWSVYSGAGLR